MILVFKEGYIKSSKIVIIIDGNLIHGITNEIVANRGDILFEDELFKGSIKTIDYNIISQPDCLLVEVDTIQFFNLIHGNFQKLMKEHIDSLSKVQIVKSLPRIKLINLSEKILEEKFNDGESIVKEGEEGISFI